MNEPHRVMIIDDDRGVREILTLAFEGEGYEVRSAADGAEGLEMLARHAADVVIVDMRMPEVDGRQFCERYARMPTGGGPVILMTAMSGRAGTADMPGVVETIAKPFDLDEVLDVVASLVSVSP